MDIPKSWTFKNKEVVIDFDDHVREQLPWYDLVGEIIVHLVNSYAQEGSLIYDLGASIGNTESLLKKLIINRQISYIPIDNSKEMKEMYKGNSELIISNIDEFNFEYFDVAISNLCLMFLPYKRRYKVLNMLKNKMKSNGCLIVIDRFIDEKDRYLSQVLHKLAMKFKMKTTDAKKILEKELSLSGVQFPMLETELDIFVSHKIFQVGHFKGFICFKYKESQYSNMNNEGF